jgi:hypothetical protein
MPEIKGHILHVFVTPEFRNQLNYAEQILGNIALPILINYGDKIDWIWIGRYDEPNQNRFQLPEAYLVDENCFRVDIRMGINQGLQKEIETYSLKLIKDHEYYPIWRDYNLYNDTLDPNGNSNNRFIRVDANEDERLRRAHLLKNFMNAVARLYLDALVEKDGQWTVEPNVRIDVNPHGNFLRSVLHMFCNSTGVPIVIPFDDEQGNTFYIQISL